MFEQLADYTVLELIIGERIVHYLEAELHYGLYFIVVAYFAHAIVRDRQRKQIIQLERAKKGKA